MAKTILITGATDGIGLETARALAVAGHTMLLHGRTPAKLGKLFAELSSATSVHTFCADLSNLADADRLADEILAHSGRLDVIINNAGVLKAADPLTADGLDIRFSVNTIAPYHLTRRLLPKLAADGRVVNLSSAAQAAVDVKALAGSPRLPDMAAYAQSKLAITMWSQQMAAEPQNVGKVIVAVNPGSLLASKMVKEGFGVEGKDLGIGVGILLRAALSNEFADATGKYYDNDAGRFDSPHRDALDRAKTALVVQAIESCLAKTGTA